MLSPRLITALIILGGVFLIAFSTAFPDLSWMLWGAEVGLSGGKLYRDFIEVNPPLIIVLNMIPQAVSRATGFSALLMYDLFVALLLVMSLWLTRRIYRKAEEAGQGPPWEWVLPTLLFGFLVIAPTFRAWGQREFITAVLVLPYIALALERAHERAPSIGTVVTAAVLCAIGIGIKPHFVIPLVAIESFVLSRRGVVRTALRPEIIIVGALLVVYLLLSMVLWPDYFRFMRELGGASAYADFFAGQLKVLLHFGTVYSVMAILVSLAVPSRVSWRPLRLLMMLATAGFLFGAIAQQKGFDYHLLPAMVFATALFALSLVDGSARRPLILVAMSIAALLLAGKIGSRGLRTVRMLATSPGTQLTEVSDVIRQYAPPGTPVMAITLHASPFFPAVTSTRTRWASAFLSISNLITDYADQAKSDAPIRYHRPEEMGKRERYVFDRIVADLVANKPALIILRRSLTDELYHDGRFNYLTYFSQDQRFRELFKGYVRLPIEGNFIYYAPAALAAKNPPPVKGGRFATRWSAVCYNCLE